MKKPLAQDSAAHPTGPVAIASYAEVLTFLTEAGARERSQPSPDLLFIRNIRGVEALFKTISAVGAAKPDANDEEWNPLSQRPHSPILPPAGNAFGAEIWALKGAIDAFTTLAHEMMHIAVWEPFFTGRWRPRGRVGFTEFSLLAEGYCFFFSDIIVSRAVRARLPDGEYAMDRQASDNARFHPVRAFDALGITAQEDIMDVYLEGFRGGRTKLWQPRGTSSYAASLAAQVHNFYQGSLLPLHELHVAIEAFGGLSEFYRRFCAIPGLPTFLPQTKGPGTHKDMKDFFGEFYRTGLQSLETASADDIARIRRRRALQMRAYYALQVRWLLSDGVVVARALSTATRRRLAGHVEEYLRGLESRLKQAVESDDLESLDAEYDAQVRQILTTHDAWVGHRWLIVPRRAGGVVSVEGTGPLKDKDAKVTLLRLTAYLIDELTRRMRQSKTVAERAAVMSQIQRISNLGAAGDGKAAQTRAALRRLRGELAKPYLREMWSVPLASFDPAGNLFRELAFAYQ